jgi:peptide/nickel transport system substrate-binding protein
VRFHDVPLANGRAVRAQDVLRTVERYRDNPVAVNKLWHASILESIQATDDRTLRVTTRIPYVYTLAHMNAIGAGAIIPAEATDNNTDLTPGGPGSGPFTVGAIAFPDRASVIRFDGHYDAANIRLDGIAWEFFPDDTARRRAFEELRVDVIPVRDAIEAAYLRELDGVATEVEPSLAYLSLGLRTDRPPFNDERLRRALDLAIDRAALLEVASQGEGIATGPINGHLATGFWSLSMEEIISASGGEDIERRRTEARGIIEAAGALAFKLQVADTPELLDLATLLRDQLTSVGAFVVLEPVPQLAAFVNLRQGNFDAILISHQPHESPDIPARLYHSRGPEDTTSPFAFQDPEIDALVERSWGEADREQRRDTLIEAQRLMFARRPLVQLISPVGYTVWHDHVNDMPEALPGSLRQFYARQWLDLPVDGRPD